MQFTVVFLLATAFLVVLSTERTALFVPQHDVILKGHVIERKHLNSILSCVHYCLAFSSCVSFNYKKVDAQNTGGCCELNDCVLNSHHRLSQEAGAVFGQLKAGSKAKDFSFLFTPLGAKGRLGPTNTSGYAGTALENKVVLQNGSQIWSVPISGTYLIEAGGASGSNGSYNGSTLGWKLGGLGARIKGHFEMTRGTKLKIVVGQQGLLKQKLGLPMTGGGGGGTFVTLLTCEPLIVAGGGGGGANSNPSKGGLDGDPGQATTSGSRNGGSGGSGGLYHSNDKSTDAEAGTGAGLLGAGQGGRFLRPSQSFFNGSEGGRFMDYLAEGGFGGGGAPFKQPGGGGGYSGGGVIRLDNLTVAGGGGSFNSGFWQENQSGVNKGDGYVLIKLLL